MLVREKHFSDYSLEKYFVSTSWFHWESEKESFEIRDDLKQYETTTAGGKIISQFTTENKSISDGQFLKNLKNGAYQEIKQFLDNNPEVAKTTSPSLLSQINRITELIRQGYERPQPAYLPSNRAILPAIEYSWAGLLRDDIGLPKDILEFANNFSLSRKDIPELDISFLNVKYFHRNGQDFIQIPESEVLFRLYETASGIQSVTPMLVLLEHLSRNTEQAQSFIIEEPELNLYPTAQQGLLNWLVEKCTKGKNDLTITTHSPYILSHLNLLLYAYQVAEKHPDRREAVAAIVPESSWINPKEFACYQVENGGVQSLVDMELGLIDNNELDGLSGDAADAFDNLIRLSKGFAIK